MNDRKIHFTVRSLIETLKNFPPDMPVLTVDYEDGFEHINEPKIMEVSHKPERPYYSGEFQEKENSNTRTIKAVVIRRNVRDMG